MRGKGGALRRQDVGARFGAGATRARSGRTRRSLWAAFAAFALAATTAVVGAAPAVAAGDFDGTVSGNVFLDYSSTGWNATGDAETGVARSRPVEGVTVDAYDAVGDLVGHATSAADGTYNLDVEDAFSVDLRLEFSDWPSQYEPAFAAQGPEPVSAIGSNDTSVQFAQIGDTDADFGLIVPAAIIQANAPISTVIQYAGAPGANGNIANDYTAIASQPWSLTGSSGDPGHFDTRNSLGTFEQVGSTWGLSYNRTRNMMLASAVLKRMSGLSEAGVAASNPLGTIFRMDDVLLPNGDHNAAATNNAVGWFNVTDLGIDVGTVPNNAARGLTTHNQPARDVPGFAQAARVGIGGIATNLDGRTLWISNLADSDLYAINIENANNQPTESFRINSPAGANQQIWAVTLYQDRLYVGVVDTGNGPGQSADAANMNAYVYSTPANALTFDGNGAAVDLYPTWREELVVDLGYTKGTNAAGTTVGAPTQNANGVAEQRGRWNSWTDTWNWGPGQSPSARSVAMLFNGWGTGTDGRVQIYPQPILSSIAFDIDGYMNLGFADRTQLQGGNVNWSTVPGDNNFYEALANGDILVAAPSSLWQQNTVYPNGCPDTKPSGTYILECNGKVGERDVRTSNSGPWSPAQPATANNNQGPATGEFFNDRRDLGRGDIHNENTLGSIVTYPGVDEVASSAMDPLDGLYRSGIMWFDQRYGTASRGYDQVNGEGEHNTAEFQKGGGLGAVALLGVAAPVEIGNRVWLDADLNGRQDADEPGINGAVVELWTQGENGNAGELIGTRTTASVNDQPGTYYFRSDDPDIAYDADEPDAPAFVANEDYVLVFGPGTDVELDGVNAGHPGFEGLRWDDLKLTTAQVSTEGTGDYSGATDEVNDSNPVPNALGRAAAPTGSATGSYAISVGGPGENNHTYDAGYFGTNSYGLEKLFNPSDVTLEPGTTYTFEVASAENFRGEDRLGDGGPALVDGLPTGDLPQDPQVTEIKITVDEDGEWTWESDLQLPLGYTLTLKEDGAAGDNLVWSDPVKGDPTTGTVTITPSKGESARATITATNLFGGFEITKAVTGDGADRVGEDVLFKVLYKIGDGAEQTGWVSQATPFTVDSLPVGTKVSFREADPIETDPADIVGVTWGDPAWTVPSGVSGPDDDGWYTLTVPAPTDENPDSVVELGLTNTAEEIVGGFSITKTRSAGAELQPDQAFTFEYKVGADGTVQTLGPIVAGEIASSPQTIPHGTCVYVREIPPAPGANFTWNDPVWSGVPEAGDCAAQDGWLVFPIASAATIALTADNVAVEQFGAFNVTKTVETTGNPDVDGQEFALEYRTGTGDPIVWTEPVGFTLTDGQTSVIIGDLPLGTIVQVRETQPTNVPGVSWGTPSWTVGGESATVVDGWAQFTITEDTLNTTVELEVTNSATETYGSFTLQKALDGTGSALATDLEFPVDVQIGDGDVETVQLAGDGTVWAGPDDLEIGTVVKVREVTPLPEVEGVEWGTPTWAASGDTEITTDDDGWTVFTIADETGAALTVTNYPTQLFGAFQVKKNLTVVGDPTVVPADTEYTVEYQIGDADPVTLTLTADETSALIGDLPFGTVVNVREQAPPAIDGVVWGDPTWTVDGTAVTPDADGWVTFTISSTTTVAFEVTNTATQQFGQFQVAKTVSGDGADLVPDDAVFTFEFTLGDGAPQQITATSTAASEIIGNLPYGTVVTITEIGFPDIPGIEWGDPAWTIDGVAATEPVTFTIDGTTLVELQAENTATRTYGTFELTKQLTGEGLERVPDDASFTVEYSLDGGDTWTELDPITKDNLTVTGPDILVGTDVQLREVAPTGGTDFEWGTPEFVVDGESQGETAAFTVTSKDQLIEVVLTNEALRVDGTFAVTKQVTGDFALTDPELAELAFTVAWSGGDREGTIVLDADGGWTGGPVTPPFAVGTQITLTEAEVTGLPPHVQWEGYSWAAGEGVEVSADGRTATLTVAGGEPAELVVTNEFTELTGTLAVEKVVSGDFELSDPELSGLTFEVAYEASTGATGTLTLDAAGEWRAELGSQLPTGTTVTLTEVVVDQSTLPPNVQWDGYSWVAVDGVEISEDGLTATVVIGDGTDVQLQVDNRFSELTGAFGVQKVVSGDFELTDPQLAGQEFEVSWTADNGATGTLVLDASNGWFAAAEELPAGTEVTLTEVAPTDLAPSVSWDGYTWLEGLGYTVSEDGQTATLTVGTGDPVRLQVENTFTELLGDFAVAKSVTGDFELSDPELSDLTFTVPWTADNGASGELALTAAGDWTAQGASLPVGTVVTLTEADVTGLPAHVVWDGYTWLVGDGYEVSEDGLDATLTVGDGVTVELGLENAFSEQLGGFTITKQVTGEGAERVPADTEFVVEYSLDGGETWVALPALTLDAPTVSGPSDVPVGTTVLVREVEVASVPGVTWGAPAFSGTGVTPGVDGEPTSFVVADADTSVAVLLTNPTSELNGQFQVTKKVTGAGGGLLSGDPVFTVEYTYEGQEGGPGVLGIRNGQVASSEPIAAGTVVTITEVAPSGGLVAGAQWGTPVFVLADGTTIANGGSFTVGADEVLALLLENPVTPPMPPTGANGVLVAGVVAGGLLLLGGVVLLVTRRRRSSQ